MVSKKLCPNIVDRPSIDEVDIRVLYVVEAVWTVQSISIDGLSTMCGQGHTLTLVVSLSRGTLTDVFYTLLAKWSLQHSYVATNNKRLSMAWIDGKTSSKFYYPHCNSFIKINCSSEHVPEASTYGVLHLHNNSQVFIGNERVVFTKCRRYWLLGRSCIKKK
jgi:hypothetical protein